MIKVIVDRTGLFHWVLDRPRIVKTDIEVIPSFKTLQMSLWDFAAVGREPCFSMKNGLKKYNSKFQINNLTLKL